MFYTYKTLHPLISLQTLQRQSDANVVSEIEWFWKHGKANTNASAFLFQGHFTVEPTEFHSEMVSLSSEEDFQLMLSVIDR